MKRVGLGLGSFLASLSLAIVFSFVSASPAVALDTTPSPTSSLDDPPLVVTSYAFSGSELQYVQIYNNTDQVQPLAGWSVEYTVQDSAQATSNVELISFDDFYLEPRRYLIVANSQVIPDAPFVFSYQSAPSTADFIVSSVGLLPVDSERFSASELVADLSKVDFDGLTYYIKRNVSASSFDVLKTVTTSLTAPDPLYMDPLYNFPLQASLQISEVLVNASSCAPSDEDPSCLDYVKIYNPTNAPIELNKFRLRNGYQGQNPTSGNAVSLSGVLQPNRFAVIYMSVINTSSWLWLEDKYGYQAYPSTEVEYPSGTSSFAGQAWAYDTQDGQWKWTTQPTPYTDRASVFVTEVDSEDDAELKPCEAGQERNPATNRCRKIPQPTALKPCHEGQERNPETNRCRKIVNQSQLVPCRSGQERNPATNRCRSIVSAANSLVPCKAGQERNPATNRCRKIQTADQGLKPCAKGQERNPATNRCRNIPTSQIPQAGFAVEPIEQAAQTAVGWWALGGISIVALGYAGWEWRHELGQLVRRIIDHGSSGGE